MPALALASMVEHEAAEMGPECGAVTSPVSKEAAPQKRRLMGPDEFQQVGDAYPFGPRVFMLQSALCSRP